MIRGGPLTERLAQLLLHPRRGAALARAEAGQQMLAQVIQGTLDVSAHGVEL